MSSQLSPAQVAQARSLISDRGVQLQDVVSGRDRIRRFWGDSKFDPVLRLAYGQDPAKVRAWVIHMLPITSLWWVSGEMSQLLDHASRSMPDQVLVQEDIPNPCGIVFFGRPLQGIDSQGGNYPLTIHAMQWLPVLRPDRTVDLDIWTYNVLRTGQWIPLGASDWTIGTPLTHGRMSSDRANQSGEEDRRRLAALWTLVQQERLASATEERNVSRQSYSKLRSVSTVKVIRLRRQWHAGGSTSGAGSTEWANRWIVSGHWRNQWLPSRGMHRLQWIAPYVKGPEDKPLIVRETVRALVR